MTAHVTIKSYEVTATDKYVTGSTMRNLGMSTAYEHVVDFLRDEGGSASVKAIQNHLAKIALSETHISVHTFFRKTNWDQFRQGIHMVNPAVWGPSYTARFGEPLPIYVGKTHTRGEWDLIEVGACSPIDGPDEYAEETTVDETVMEELVAERELAAVAEATYAEVTRPKRRPILDLIARFFLK